MPIALNTSADLGNNNGSMNPWTVSYTVGSGSRRLLVVVFLGNNITGADDITSVRYAGTAMTLAAKQVYTGATYPTANRFLYFYYLLNPASGANNVVFTSTPTHYFLALAADYTGVGSFDHAATAFRAVTPGSGAAVTTNVTVTSANSWVMSVDSGVATAGAAGLDYILSTNLTRQVYAAAYHEPIYWDSNGTVPRGTFAADRHWASGQPQANLDLAVISASFAPAGLIEDEYDRFDPKNWEVAA